MRIDQGVADEDAVFMVHEDFFLTEDNASHAVSGCRDVFAVKLTDVFVTVGAEVAAPVLVQAQVELGAVLEALSLACGNHALKLGMGKALGFGSITLELVRAEVEDVRERYVSLVERMKGNRPCLDAGAQSRLRERFRQDRLERLHALGRWKTVSDYDALPPVKELHVMTDFARRPAAAMVRFMSLNEFKKKALLVGPEEVLKRRQS